MALLNLTTLSVFQKLLKILATRIGKKGSHLDYKLLTVIFGAMTQHIMHVAAPPPPKKKTVPKHTPDKCDANLQGVFFILSLITKHMDARILISKSGG
jgi:hypothetical protein